MTRKAKGSGKLGFAEGFGIVASVFLLVMLLKNSQLASAKVVDALIVCSKMLIPSLFPLTVASEIATGTGAVEYITKRFRAPFAKLLGVSESATSPYFLGLIGGYTSSCKSAVMLYSSKKISKRDCESVIALSNMPSLAFLTGFVGVGIFKNSTVGWFLWSITVISTIILGWLNRLLDKKDKSIKNDATFQKGVFDKKSSFSRILVDAIAHSAQAMLVICACVVFFSVLIAVLEFAIENTLISETIKKVFLGAFEITYGVGSCTEIQNNLLRAIICAFFIGWSGTCVHFQVIALCEQASISFRRYFFLKALQGVICAALAFVVFSIYKI